MATVVVDLATGDAITDVATRVAAEGITGRLMAVAPRHDPPMPR
jgi:hypothetical protein